MQLSIRRLKYACYITNISLGLVTNFFPLLFLTFRTLYGISYSLLGLLVLINFCTQFAVDLLFSFFSHRFNISIAVKITPLLNALGLLIFALSPWVLPYNMIYIGFVIGTLLFSASGGFIEVLLTPVFAQLPADDKDREMSKLHSACAWGIVAIVLFATFYIFLLGSDNWQWLVILLALIPISAFILYLGTEIPKTPTAQKNSGELKILKNKHMWLCLFAMFLGGASECTMAQWCSSYIERSLRIPKLWGDIFGAGLFATTLGIGRSLYAKRGKNIERILFLCSIGATLCYLVAALSEVAVIGVIACAATGLFVSMLWPGMLIVASDRFSSGVYVIALMAAAGDLGASVGPQLVGIVTDFVMTNSTAIKIAESLAITTEQLGMKAGMLVGMTFPMIAVLVYFLIWKHKKRAAVKNMLKP